MKARSVLGIDPGLETGFAYMPDGRRNLNLSVWSNVTDVKKRRRTDPNENAIARDDAGELLWRTWTHKVERDGRDAGSPWPKWIDMLGRECATSIVRWEPDLVAVEIFEHQGFRGRRISLEAEMGMCVARIISLCEKLDVPVVSVRPVDTAANMGWLEKYLPTTHEVRAIGAALWASGRARA